MSDKKIAFIFSIFLLIVALLILFYVFRVEEGPSKPSTYVTLESPLLQKVSESFPNYYDFINPMNCSIPKSNSLINIAYIRKTNLRIEITCEFGPLYNELDYQYFSDVDVWFGLIKYCGKNAAFFIDDAVRTQGNCIFPLDNPIPSDLTDYYVVYFACNKYENTLPPGKNECYSEITNLGKTTFYTGTLAVIDINKRIVYA